MVVKNNFFGFRDAEYVPTVGYEHGWSFTDKFALADCWYSSLEDTPKLG